MPSVLERVRALTVSAAGALPGAAEVAGLTAQEQAEATRVLGQLHQAVGRSISLLAADIERKSARELGTDGLAQRNGFSDGAGLVQELTGLGRGEAARLIRVGGLLEAAEAVAPAEGVGVAAAPPPRDLAVLRELPGAWDAPIGVAVRNLWLSAAQGDALRSGLGRPRGELADRWREAMIELVSDCWDAQWNADDLGKAAKKTRTALDALAAQADAAERYRQRSLRRSVRASGMVHYDLDLDPESDARFYGPIRRLLSPRFGGPRFTTEPEIAAARELEEDPRSNEQLQADTLVQLIDHAVAADDNDLFKTGEPHVMVAVTVADLKKARDTQEALNRHHAGDHTACPPTEPRSLRNTAGASRNDTPADCPGPDAGVAWIDGRDEPITATDALRLICGSGFTPILFDETGQAIDVGKDRRYFTRRQRRALAKRDGGCRFPGCERPPDECEAHHLNPWAQHPSHRKSEVRDGILLCRRHHKMTHDHGARIERRGSEYRLHWPGRQPQPLPSKSAVIRQLRAQRKIA